MSDFSRCTTEFIKLTWSYTWNLTLRRFSVNELRPISLFGYKYQLCLQTVGSLIRWNLFLTSRSFLGNVKENSSTKKLILLKPSVLSAYFDEDIFFKKLQVRLMQTWLRYNDVKKIFQYPCNHTKAKITYSLYGQFLRISIFLFCKSKVA